MSNSNFARRPNHLNYFRMHPSWTYFMHPDVNSTAALLYFFLLNRSQSAARVGDDPDIRVAKGTMMGALRVSEKPVEHFLETLIRVGYLSIVSQGNAGMPNKWHIKPWADIVEEFGNNESA